MQTDADKTPPAGEPEPRAELAEYRPGDETEIVKVLDAVQPQGWGDAEYWRWKHGHRPGFRTDDVWSARVEARMVACFHGAVLPIKLEQGLEVPMSFDGDYAVLPEHRRQGIPLRAYDLSDRALLARHVALRGGFTSQELNERFYHKQFGYVFVPSVTTQYRKILGPGPLRPRVAALGERLLERPALRRRLERRPLVVALRIESFPACHLVAAGGGWTLERGEAERPDLIVQAPYRVIAALADGVGAFAKLAARELVCGRVRVSGAVRQAPRLIALGVAALRRG